MKSFLIFCLIIANSLSNLGYSVAHSSGQSNYEIFTLKDLIRAYHIPNDDWEEEMVKFKYELFDKNNGSITYYKGEIGTQIQTVTKNSAGLVSVSWWDYIEKKRMFKHIEDQVKDGFIKTVGKTKYFVYQNYSIGIECHMDDIACVESIYITMIK